MDLDEVETEKDIEHIAEKIDTFMLSGSASARKPVNPERAYYEEINTLPMMTPEEQLEKSKQVRLFKRQLITVLSRPEFSGLLYTALHKFYTRDKETSNNEENPIYRIKYWPEGQYSVERQDGNYTVGMIHECLDTIDRIDNRIDELYTLYLDNQDILSVKERRETAAKIRFKENNKQRILQGFSYKCITLTHIVNELNKHRNKHNRWRIAFITKIYNCYKSPMDLLTKSNLRLVTTIAKKFPGNYRSELIQEGNQGLMEGINNFDYSRGYKLATYITWWIRQKMQSFIRLNKSVIRIPINFFEINSRIRKAQNAHFTKTGETLDDKTLSSVVGRSISNIHRIARTMTAPLSIDHAFTNDTDPMSALTPDCSSPDPADETRKILLKERIESMLDTLKNHEKEIIKLRYSLDGGFPHTLKEIGEKLNISRERVRQIQAKAIRKLQHPTRSRGLKVFLDNVA